MKLRTFYKKLEQAKNKFRWNFGVKDGTSCIRATPRSKYCCAKVHRCPIEAIFIETDDFAYAEDLANEHDIEKYQDIMSAADNKFEDLDYTQKRIRRRMLEILKGA